MDQPSMGSYLKARNPEPKPSAGSGPQWPIILVITGLLGAVVYILYDNNKFQQKTAADLAVITDHIKALESHGQAGEAKLSGLISQAQEAVGHTKAELKRTAQQFQAESQKSKAELSEAISAKADTTQVQALKQEAESKIGQVSTEVGGVKTEVGTVKTDLASTKQNLEGTQRQLLDVKETLSAAVARNASELADLRRKGERDYFEFEIPKKNVLTKVEDIRLVLTKTDPKKGKYSVSVIVDDSKLEKRDRTVNEPVQFLVGRDRLRYELVINWVQKDKIGGYLSTPKDKGLSAERATAKTN
jgi:chromosome segregation ATPase